MKVKVNISKLKEEKSESEKHLCLLPGSQLDLKLCLQARDARFQPGQVVVTEDHCFDCNRLDVIIIVIIVAGRRCWLSTWSNDIFVLDDLCIDHDRFHVIIIFIDSLLSTLPPRDLPLKLLLQLCVRPGENKLEAWFNKRWSFN